jgi:hypothetical protein
MTDMARSDRPSRLPLIAWHLLCVLLAVDTALILHPTGKPSAFGHGSAGDGGVPFGRFSMNLLAPFDSAGYSHLLPALPRAEGQHEGFAWPGLGGWLILLAAFAAALVRRAWTGRCSCCASAVSCSRSAAWCASAS